MQRFMRWTLTFFLTAALCGTFGFAQNPEPKTQNPKSLRPELDLQIGHSGGVMSVAFSPDGKTLASGSQDKTVKLWDTRSGELKRTLTGHNGWVTSLAFSPDGKTLASGSMDRETRLWDVEGGRLKHTLMGGGLSVAFSPDGRLLASGDKLWDVETGSVKRTLKEAGSLVAFSPDGKTLASAAFNTFNLLNVETGEVKRRLTGQEVLVRSIAFSPDGKTVVIVDRQNPRQHTIKFWDVETGEIKRTFKLPFCFSVAFAPDGKTFASGWSGSDNLKLWDVESGEVKRTLKEDNTVMSLAFSPGGKTLASGSIEKTVKLWDVEAGRVTRTLWAGESVLSVALSHDGKTLASASEHGVVRLWHLEMGNVKRTLTGAGRPVAFWLNDRTLISGSKLWDLETGSVTRTLTAHDAFSPDGKILAVRSKDPKSVELRDAQTGNLTYLLTGHASNVWSVTFSPDGKALVSASHDKTVRLWDVSTGQLKRTLKADAGALPVIAFSPDGKTLAIAEGTLGRSVEVKLWDVETGGVTRTLRQNKDSWVNSAAFSPDGKTLAIAATDLFPRTSVEVKLWDVNTGELKRTLTGHQSMVMSIVFSPDGRRLATGGFDNTVRIWEPTSGRQLAALMTLPPREGETVSSDYLVLTPEGYYDGSAGAGRFIKWRVGNDLFPVDAYEKVFHRPSLVRKALRGEAVPKAEREVERFLAGQLIPPQVAFSILRDGQEVAGESLSVELSATDDKTVKEMELFVNGRPLAAKPIEVGAKPLEVGAKPIEVGAKPIPTSHKTIHQFKVLVPLPPGEKSAILKAVAHDDEDLQGWEEIHLIRRLVAPVQGDLYVLAVGVSQYQNPKFNLKYAARDADAFAALWEQTQGTLYRRVVVTRLTDAQATATNVRGALFKLIETATDKDSVALFLSGHGVQLEQAEKDFSPYYFATHEIDAATAARVAETALPWTVFQTMLAKVDAKRVLLFLDACHSGNSLGGQQANNERLAELLVKRAGVMVFASSRGSEFSYELDARQHGAFTTALVEGIGDGRADLDIGTGRDGVITVEELLTYLRARVPQLTGNLQTPTCPLMRDFGEAFPLAKVK